MSELKESMESKEDVNTTEKTDEEVVASQETVTELVEVETQNERETKNEDEVNNNDADSIQERSEEFAAPVPETEVTLNKQHENIACDSPVEDVLNMVVPDNLAPTLDIENHVLESSSSENDPENNSSSSTTVTSAPSKTLEDVIKDSVYHLKWITWHDRRTPIVTQNENGPCPLIAISNILLLTRRILLPSVMEMITAKQLVEYIGDLILENVPQNMSEGRQLNFEQNMHDAMSVLPRLPTGIDVNIKFTGVKHFEFTPECIIFDLLNIPLYHGWLVDPQCSEVVSALGSLGYNQIVEKIIANKLSAKVELVTEALVAEQFLERTASQLTYHGLCELHTNMEHDELAVLFRNNHFSTIFKKKVCGPTEEASSELGMSQEWNELFQLVTDQGFLHEPRVVWETISNIEGDGVFVDGRFVTVPPNAPGPYRPFPGDVSEDQQINHDYLVALSLQEEQKKQQESEKAWEEFKQMQEITSDEELARCLHEDERRRAQSPVPVAAVSHGHNRQYAHAAAQPTPVERNKKGSCNIL